MTISVVCGQCSRTYEIDQGKYGGKRIRCKDCATVLEVPRAPAADELEVVEDGPKPVIAAGPTAAPTEVLGRSRIVGLKSAVALSQLQRAEPSRSAIRKSVLALHGDDAKRLAWRQPYEAKVASLQADIRSDEEQLEAFKLFLIQQGGTSGYFKAFSSDFRSMFEQAVKILGAPVRPLPPGTDFGSRVTGMITDGLLGVYTGRGLLWGKQQMADKNKLITEANAIALETIQEAATRIEAGMPQKIEALTAATATRDEACRQREAEDRSDLGRLEELIQQGEHAEATGLGSQLLKRVPVSDVGNVLVALSRSAFLSGNAADAARLMQDAICFGMPAPGGMVAAFNDLWTKAEAGLPEDTHGGEAADEPWVVLIDDWGKNKRKCIELLGSVLPDRPSDFVSLVSEADCTEVLLVDGSREQAEDFAQMVRQGGVSASVRVGLTPSETGRTHVVLKLHWRG